MRVAALCDVHGNLPALEVALREARRLRPDAIVCGGDVAGGPFPAECIALLREAGARFVRGNADRVLDDWAAQRLSDEERAFLRDLPTTIELDVDGLGRVLFCHATPRSDEDVFTEEIADADVLELFGPLDADVVVCGHTHMQADRLVGSLRVVNAGSVGMPYEGARGAFWALLGPDVQLRRTRYDAKLAAALIRRSGWPGADGLAELLLTPPTRREALDAFTPRFRRR